MTENEKAIREILRRPAWSPKIGVGTFLTIDFGSSTTKIIRNREVTRGEFHIWIYGLPWRLDNHRKVITGSGCENLSTAQVSFLEGLEIVDIALNGFGISLEWSSGVVLTSFFDGGEDEFIFFIRDQCIAFSGSGVATSVNC